MKYTHWTEQDLIAANARVRSGGNAIPAEIALKCRQVANPASSPSKIYKNKWEENFAYGLVLEKRCGQIKDWGYEVMTLKLAKGKYHRPDFTIWHLDGTIEQAAVKGYHKNLRDSMTHLAWAAQQHPWFRFTIKRWQGQGWESSEVRP